MKTSTGEKIASDPLSAPHRLPFALEIPLKSYEAYKKSVIYKHILK
jgi:hypothetical protein